MANGLKSAASLFSGIVVTGFLLMLLSCDKEPMVTNIPSSTNDSIVVSKTVPGDVIIEIDEMNTTWYLVDKETQFAPANGLPGQISFLKKTYRAYFRESNKDWIFLEEGIIRDPTIIDGVSWN